MKPLSREQEYIAMVLNATDQRNREAILWGLGVLAGALHKLASENEHQPTSERLRKFGKRIFGWVYRSEV